MAETSTRYRVDGMDCAGCAARISTAVKRVPGVEEVDVSVTAGTMTVRHAGAPGLQDAVLRQVNLLGGYSATPLPPRGAAASGRDRAPHEHGHDHHGHRPHGHGHDEAAEAGLHGHAHDHGPTGGPWWRNPRGLLTLACGLALVAAWVVGRLAPAAESWAFGAAMLVGLVPVARRAFVSARLGTPFSIETLMVIAAIGATLIGATEEAATVVLLFLIGELLEGMAAGRARASIQALSELVPATALLEEGGRTREVPAAELPVGATVLVRPGDRISADGTVIEGTSAVDEAPVTGESVPKRKAAGDTAFAGTVNGEGVLRLRVTAAAQDNTIARVVRLVEEAQESKAPTERFIDRFSRTYTPAVLVLGALVAVLPPLVLGGAWAEWIYKGLAILLIGCPCALVISTPAAIAAGLSAGARRGLLTKGGAVLEGLGRIDAIALDKTGTLTEGRPKVTDLLPADGDARALLARAAALETGSSHPLALAILARAEAEGVAVLPATAAAAHPGEGVAGQVGGQALFLGAPGSATAGGAIPPDWTPRIEALQAEGKSVSVLLADGRFQGLIASRDEPRADAKAGLDALKAMGVAPVMLTGDNPRAAEAIGTGLGLPVRAGLLPEDKQQIVRTMQAEGKRVAKVGDGINDAPALAAADIGIAMGGGTDVALETADAAVLHGRVMDLSRMVALSRAAMANIHQNIAIALGLKAVFLVTTLVGITGLWPAILADTGATVLVTANAMRLLAWRG